MKKRLRSSSGMVLIVTLCLVVIVTILVVGLSTAMRLEQAAGRDNFESVQARFFAEVGLHEAIGAIRDATTAGEANGKFWSSQPGQITVFNSDGTVNAAKLLYSVTPANTAVATVDLNQASFDGTNPIASPASVGSATAPAINAQWINVLQNPNTGASSNNPVVGRYAFWVDDETTKINVNTADGGNKGTGDWYGSGNPADVSLQAVTNVSSSAAQAIAEETGVRPNGTGTSQFFNSAAELGQVSGVGTNVYYPNNFNLTHYSKAPEINIFGEPKIYLTVSTNTNGTINNAMLGRYDYNGTGTPGASTAPQGLPMTQIYPTSTQLPLFTGTSGSQVPLPQSFTYERSMNNPTNLVDSNMGYRIAKYLSGTNSVGNAINWPSIGSSSRGYSEKYTARQIDSMALQILSLMDRGVFADHWRAGSLPLISPGWLSHQLVKGLSRAPKLNEIEIDFTATTTNIITNGTNYNNIAKVNIKAYLEWYMPKEYLGYPLTQPYDAGGAVGYTIDGGEPAYLNSMDVATNSTNSVQAPLGGFWRDNLLYFVDQNDSPAGVDLNGNPSELPDPDPGKAALYHPWTLKTSGTYAGKYLGTGPGLKAIEPALRMMPRLVNTNISPAGWAIGEYHCVGSYTNTSWMNAVYLSKTNVTSLRVKGGLVVWAGTESGDPEIGYNIDPVPLDSIHGQPFLGETIAAQKSILTNAVIPMPTNAILPVPGTLSVHFEVADPLVNSMPGDWIASVSSGTHVGTMQYPADNAAGPTQYMNGQNISAQASGTTQADPAALWWPQQTNGITKLQRFPSSGYLQYIRPGMMPDLTNSALPLSAQHGTPFQLLNFGPSTSVSQGAYPDWAMLNLFTVPAALQPTNGSGSSVLPYINLTSGGATLGRLNPNPIVTSTGTLSRIIPLQALFLNQPVSTTAAGTVTNINATSAANLATAVGTYVKGLGRPLMLPGEICNVPAIADYVYQGVPGNAQSRNDLVRDIIGNLTTQSDTFTVWVVGQVIKKKPSNTDYRNVEATDTVLGESRMAVLVERYIDTGMDGVPGNAASPGSDGVVGTADDPIDAKYNPAFSSYPLPYKYRILGVRQISQ